MWLLRRENEPRAAPRPADVRVEALVLLLVHEGVGALRLEKAVAVDAIRALGRILDPVEERHVVRRPHGARRLLDALGPEGVRAQVLDEERVLPEARRVRRVREKVPVVAHGVSSERHELLALRELVQVEGDLLGSVGKLLPAVDAVLLPLLGAEVVQPVALAVRHGEVGLLDVGEHLGVQRVLKRLRRLHHRGRVRVLGLEVGGDLRVRLVAQPEVRIGSRLAVQRDDLVDALGHRRRRHGRGDGGLGKGGAGG